MELFWWTKRVTEALYRNRSSRYVKTQDWQIRRMLKETSSEELQGSKLLKRTGHTASLKSSRDELFHAARSFRQEPMNTVHVQQWLKTRTCGLCLRSTKIGFQPLELVSIEQLTK